jgi:MFS family permease
MAWLSEIDAASKGGRLGASVTCSSVGVMAGPALSGVLAQHAGIGTPFLVIALVSGVVAAALTLGSLHAPQERPEMSTAETDSTDSPRPTLASLAALLRRPGFGEAAAGLIVAGAVSGTAQLLITLGLHNSGLSTGRIGLAFSAAAVAYILVSAAIVRLGDRVHTLRLNALATTALALALVPALTGGGPPALVIALVLTALPRAAISTVAYSLASTPSGESPGAGEGFVFGMLNGAWAAAMVLTPLLAGALDQHGGASAGYLGVIIPSCAIGAWLVARARPYRARTNSPRPQRATPAAP